MPLMRRNIAHRAPLSGSTISSALGLSRRHLPAGIPSRCRARYSRASCRSPSAQAPGTSKETLRNPPVMEREPGRPPRTNAPSADEPRYHSIVFLKPMIGIHDVARHRVVHASAYPIPNPTAQPGAAKPNMARQIRASSSAQTIDVRRSEPSHLLGTHGPHHQSPRQSRRRA